MAMILDIDAFNHNHSNDGLASMANQPKANTSDSNQQFLSYYGDYTIKMSIHLQWNEMKLRWQ